MMRGSRPPRTRRLPAWLLLAAIASLMPMAAATARAEPPRVYAITGARVITEPGAILESGTVIVRDGLIEAVGPSVRPPADAVVIDGSGRTLTAGFIDACSKVGRPGKEKSSPGSRDDERESPRGAGHALEKIHPERRVADEFVVDEDALAKYRSLGFTVAISLPTEGIFRGQAAVVALREGTVPEILLHPNAGQVVAFETGRFGRDYPTSLMGSIAAVRQTLLDARRSLEWSRRYASDPVGMRRPERNAAFAALAGVVEAEEAVLFDIEDASNTARALRIAEELRLRPIVILSGQEHEEIGALDAMTASDREPGWILPLHRPETPDVEDPDAALNVTLRELEAWDRAPDAARILDESGIRFAVGTCRLDTQTDFTRHMREAIDRGLAVETALASLTTVPAELLGQERTIGAIKRGAIANLVLFEGADETHGVFAEKARAIRVFIDGRDHLIEEKKNKDEEKVSW